MAKQCECRIVPGADIQTTASGTTVPSGGEQRAYVGPSIEFCPTHARAEAMETALERMLLYVTDRDAFETRYGRPDFPESAINVEAWRDKTLLGPARAALGESGA